MLVSWNLITISVIYFCLKNYFGPLSILLTSHIHIKNEKISLVYFHIKKPAIYISFFSFDSSYYLGKKIHNTTSKRAARSEWEYYFIIYFSRFCGVSFFFFPPIPTMYARHTKYIITWESHTAFKGAIQVNCVNNMPLKTLTYEYRFTSYEVVIYLRDENMHLKKFCPIMNLPKRLACLRAN